MRLYCLHHHGNAGWSDCCTWINYTHQKTWAQYPALTAKQQRMANNWNKAGAFKNLQAVLQFYPNGDDLRMIGSDDDN
ncbi:MAG: hypothetical protein IJ325_12625 [Clostridia bacterium]|nr:hypothetical protein [Clostridia bacterium]